METTSKLYLNFDENSNDVPLLIKEQWNIIASDLEDRHAIFYKLWEIGSVEFSYMIDTAAVVFSDKNFDESTSIRLLFNPKFWNSVSEYTILFIMCHEMMHLILNHGFRAKDKFNTKHDRDIWNISNDIVVNHLLVDKFGFVRERITNSEKLCWVDTVFADKSKDAVGELMKILMNIKFPRIVDSAIVSQYDLRNKSIVTDSQHTEYYVLRLIEMYPPSKFSFKFRFGNKKSSGGAGGEIVVEMPSTVDDHDQYDESIKSDGNTDSVQDVTKELNDLLTSEEKQQLQDMIENFSNDEKENKTDVKDVEKNNANKAGKGAFTGMWKFPKKLTPKKAWLNVATKWAIKNKDMFSSVEVWAGKNRRLALMDSDLILPYDHEREDSEDKTKIPVWAFLDVSGSCTRYRDRFFTALNSIPKSHFAVKTFVFASRVAEMDMKTYKRGTINVGGGTEFDQIETFIRAKCAKEKRKYPRVVFIITDGAGSYVSPLHANRWHWFLTEDSGYKSAYIPQKSLTYKLSDFE